MTYLEERSIRGESKKLQFQETEVVVSKKREELLTLEYPLSSDERNLTDQFSYEQCLTGILY